MLPDLLAAYPFPATIIILWFIAVFVSIVFVYGTSYVTRRSPRVHHLSNEDLAKHNAEVARRAVAQHLQERKRFIEQRKLLR